MLPVCFLDVSVSSICSPGAPVGLPWPLEVHVRCLETWYVFLITGRYRVGRQLSVWSGACVDVFARPAAFASYRGHTSRLFCCAMAVLLVCPRPFRCSGLSPESHDARARDLTHSCPSSDHRMSTMGACRRLRRCWNKHSTYCSLASSTLNHEQSLPVVLSSVVSPLLPLFG